MECGGSSYPIRCALGEIAKAVSDGSGDWLAFWGTLATALLGSGIGALAVFLVHAREGRAAYRATLDDAAASVIRELSDRGVALSKYWDEHLTFMAAIGSFLAMPVGQQVAVAPKPPSDHALFQSTEILVMRAQRGHDQDIAMMFRQAVYEVTMEAGFEHGPGELATIGRVLRSWRSRQLSEREVVEALDVIERRAKVFGLAEVPTEASPLPYEHVDASSLRWMQ